MPRLPRLPRQGSGTAGPIPADSWCGECGRDIHLVPHDAGCPLLKPLPAPRRVYCCRKCGSNRIAFYERIALDGVFRRCPECGSPSRTFELRIPGLRAALVYRWRLYQWKRHNRALRKHRARISGQEKRRLSYGLHGR